MSMSLLWTEYLEAYSRLVSARMALHGRHAELIESLQRSLLAPGMAPAAALDLVPYMHVDMSLLLLDTLITMTLSVHGLTAQARQTIAAMPRAEAVKALSSREEGIIATEDYEQVGCLLRLWLELGESERAVGLAKQGLVHSDEDIRDVAEAFLEQINQSGPESE